MEPSELFALLSDNVLVLSLSALRISVAFTLLPLFNKDGIPALVRNTMFMALAMISIVVQPSAPFGQFDTATWINLFAKEAFIGMVLGIFFGLFLWAFEAAGVIIDMQIGASFALYFDPIVGNEVTLIGSLLSRWASFVFLASGGMLILTGALIESFALWPLTEPITSFRAASVRLFEAEYSRFMSLSMRIAGPIIVVVFIIDMCMGLINRYAQQFNVFFLSMSLKSIAAVMMMWILLPFLVDILISELQDARAMWAPYLKSIFAG